MSVEEFEVIQDKIAKRDLENELFENEIIKNHTPKTEEEKQQSKKRKSQRKEDARLRKEEAKERIKLIKEESRKHFLQEVVVDVSQEDNYYSKVMERIRDNGGVATKEDNYAMIIAAQDAVQERKIKMLQAIERQKKQQQNVENEEQEFNMSNKKKNEFDDTEIEMIEPIGWKEKYKVSNNSLAGGEYMEHIEEINSKIDKNRRVNAGLIANAQTCIVSTPKEDNEIGG